MMYGVRAIPPNHSNTSDPLLTRSQRYNRGYAYPVYLTPLPDPFTFFAAVICFHQSPITTQHSPFTVHHSRIVPLTLRLAEK